MPLASSTVMTPSLPTFCMARAIISPIPRSPLAETVPTCAVSASVVMALGRAAPAPAALACGGARPDLRRRGPGGDGLGRRPQLPDHGRHGGVHAALEVHRVH